eukprot:TRINITY_DN16931_c0_g1_i1.p1 TRINITY_DN16931_c0_g1~~TRINITY_DN16931_c0_g1_i1.p1  ORF type:complete len:651 (-),score=277.36 TRINITY_DN16931_c0_g1_i1:164-1960(-)
MSAATGRSGRTPQQGMVFVFIAVFINMLGMSVVIPILPFYAVRFGASSFLLGVLFASYNLAQGISGIFMGRFSDKYGRRPTLLLSLAGASLGFIGQGLSQSMLALIITRGFTGMAGGSLPVAQAYVADATTKQQRPRYMAFIGSAAGLSFCFGPSIGAGLAEFSISTPMFVASGLAALAFTVAFFYLPESKIDPEQRNKAGLPEYLPPADNDDRDESGDNSNKDEQKKQPSKSKRRRGLSLSRKSEEAYVEMDDDINADNGAERKKNLTAGTSSVELVAKSASQDDSNVDSEQQEKESMVAVLKKTNRLGLVTITITAAFFNMVCFMSFLTMLGLFIHDKFGLGALAYGFMASGTSLFYIIVQTVFFNKVRKRLGCALTGVIGAVVLGIGTAATPLPDSPELLVLPLMVLASGYALITPALPTLLSALATTDIQGRVLGLNQSVEAAGRVVGPMTMGALYGLGISLPFYIGGLCAAVAAVCLLVLQLRAPSEITARSMSRTSGSGGNAPSAHMDMGVEMSNAAPGDGAAAGARSEYERELLVKSLGTELLDLLDARGYSVQSDEHLRSVRDILGNAFPPVDSIDNEVDNVLKRFKDAL